MSAAGSRTKPIAAAHAHDHHHHHDVNRHDDRIRAFTLATDARDPGRDARSVSGTAALDARPEPAAHEGDREYRGDAGPADGDAWRAACAASGDASSKPGRTTTAAPAWCSSSATSSRASSANCSTPSWATPRPTGRTRGACRQSAGAVRRHRPIASIRLARCDECPCRSFSCLFKSAGDRGIVSLNALRSLSPPGNDHDATPCTDVLHARRGSPSASRRRQPCPGSIPGTIPSPGLSIEADNAHHSPGAGRRLGYDRPLYRGEAERPAWPADRHGKSGWSRRHAWRRGRQARARRRLYAAAGRDRHDRDTAREPQPADRRHH